MRTRTHAAAAFALLAVTLATPSTAAITAESDPILYWNQTMVGLVAGSPPAQTRVYAMVNIAMHDAVNAAVGRPHKSYLGPVGASGGDSRAAASQAARNVLVALDPANAAQYDAALAASLALVPDGVSKAAGIANGTAHASAILAKRAADGSGAPFPHVPGTDPGDWRPTPPAFAPGALPHWGGVTPFLMTSGDQFRPAPPPSLDSAEYAAAYNEVKEIGALGSITRTADQTASALFWDAANGSPWLRIGLLVGESQALDTIGFARSYALLTTSLADALIAGFDAKYEYTLWRPVTAIQLGDTDGNDATEGDAAWQSLFPAPAHPSYLSTHSALSGAGAGVLIAMFGDTMGFEFSIGGDTRAFTGLQQAALDGANSRLWGGIHFGFDNEAGLWTGDQISQWALAGRAFNPVPEPATWAMMLLGLGAVGLTIRRRRSGGSESTMIRSAIAMILAGVSFGAVAAQPKTSDVNVTNPELAVKVTNPDLEVSVANEVLVRTVEGAKSPFKVVRQLVMNDGDPNAFPDLVTVPAGKQLVVTYATAAVSLPAGQTVAFRINAANNVAFSAIHDLQTSASGPLVIGGANSVVASAPVAMILTAGEVLSCSALRSSSSGTASGRCSVSGYYIDAP